MSKSNFEIIRDMDFGVDQVLTKTKRWEHAVTPLDYDPGDREYSPTCELDPPDTSGTWELVGVTGGYTFWKREVVSDTTEKGES